MTVTELPGSAELAELAVGLAGLELVRVNLPRLEQVRAAHGTTPAARDLVLVRALGNDGVEGWGECSALEAPTYSGEHTDGAWIALRDLLGPAALAGRLDRVGGHPMAAAAVESALIDVALQRSGRSLLDALGGRHGQPMSWTLVAGIQSSPDVLVRDVIGDVFNSERDDPTWAWFPARTVKLKVAPGWDVAAVQVVRRAWPGLRVVVDANGSYAGGDADHLARLARALAEDAYIEQPLPAADLAGLGALAGRLDGRAIALDESVGSADDVEAAARLGAGALINLKPARVGGLRASLAVVGAARRAEPALGVFVGGMFESGVGRAVALALAASVAVGATEIDLGPGGHYYDEGDDVVDLPREGAGGDGVLAALAVRPGIGVAPSPERLAAVAVDRLRLRT